MIRRIRAVSVKKLVRRRSPKPGAPPGTFGAPDTATPTRVRLIRFDPDSVEERIVERVDEIADVRAPGRQVWIDVQGLADHAVIRRLGEAYGIHPLALSDVVNTGQRPKVEEYGECLFIVTRMIRQLESGEPDWEQVSLYVGEGFVLTFQERHGDCLDPLRDRIRTPGLRIRGAGAGYLACMVLDSIVDAFFPVLEHLGERLEQIEHRVIDQPSPDLLEEIFHAKRDLMTLRRAIWPQREFLTRLLRDGHALIDAPTIPFLRDVYDHAVHVVDVTETYRELTQSYIDVYLSSVANRTNEVMRVLTVVATIFIPLTFLTGVYGMNFDTSHALNMPELRWPFGYIGFWAICIVLAVVMLIIVRRQGWLGGGSRRAGVTHHDS